MTKDSNAKEIPQGSQSLFKALQLIEILSNYPNGCPLAHLAEQADMNKSTVHRLLQGLHAAGYVTPAPASGSYRLTTKFISVGQKALSSLNIIHVAAGHLETLNLTTCETVNFSSREDDHVILIYKLEPTTGMMRTRAYIGQHHPLIAPPWVKFSWLTGRRITQNNIGNRTKNKLSRSLGIRSPN